MPGKRSRRRRSNNGSTSKVNAQKERIGEDKAMGGDAAIGEHEERIDDKAMGGDVASVEYKVGLEALNLSPDGAGDGGIPLPTKTKTTAEDILKLIDVDCGIRQLNETEVCYHTHSYLWALSPWWFIRGLLTKGTYLTKDLVEAAGEASGDHKVSCNAKVWLNPENKDKYSMQLEFMACQEKCEILLEDSVMGKAGRIILLRQTNVYKINDRYKYTLKEFLSQLWLMKNKRLLIDNEKIMIIIKIRVMDFPLSDLRKRDSAEQPTGCSSETSRPIIGTVKTITQDVFNKQQANSDGTIYDISVKQEKVDEDKSPAAKKHQKMLPKK